jgi:arabinogalactan oligomer/maltooligosaccharide transport system substrate-binding protein
MEAARLPIPIAFLTASILAASALSAALAPGAMAAPAPITIWVDAARAATVSEFLKDGYQGHPVNVVSKELAAIKTELTTVPANQAPDIIWADNTWTGELAAAAAIIPLTLPPAKKALFAPNVLSGFQYGSNYFGVPVQFETWALVTNAELAPKPPKTFSQLSTKALALKAANRVEIGLAVGQGIKGNAYFTYPLFSGLGGYVFGKRPSGSLNPRDVGVYNSVFRKNAKIIDNWNSTGLINSSVDVAAAETAFAAGRAPFWITGPWSASTLQELKFKFFISPLPRINSGLAMAPLLGIKGFMATSYAKTHGLTDVVPDLIVKKLSKAAFQSSMAALSLRAPANKNSTYRTSVGGQLAKAFGTAGRGGVPMPNIPQASSVWGPLSKAWAKSTSGPKATPAKKAFSAAQDKIQKALG